VFAATSDARAKGYAAKFNFVKRRKTHYNANTCDACLETLRAPHPSELRGQLDLERVLKWKFLLPAILLCKPPPAKGTKAANLKPIV